MSLYADYVLERQGLHEIREAWGFIHFRISGEECFVADYFVTPEARGENKGYQLGEKLEHMAKLEGCKIITAQVDLACKNPEIATKNILNYGYRFADASNNILSFYKEL